MPESYFSSEWMRSRRGGGYTTATLSRALGVTTSHVAMMRRNQRRPSRDLGEKLATLTGNEPDFWWWAFGGSRVHKVSRGIAQDRDRDSEAASIRAHIERAEKYLQYYDEHIDAHPNAMVVTAPNLQAATAHALTAVAQLMWARWS